MKINNFALIIGAMKCGTTSLFNYLSEHPQIALPVFKEPNFFSYDERWNNGREWYFSRWKNWNPQQHKIALEASTNYSKFHSYPQVINRIKSLEQEANFKFIYIVRNPIDRIESHYTYALAAGREKLKSLTKEIDSELIETSKYAKQIQLYYDTFDSNSILILNFNDLKKFPQETIKKVCSFLEINSCYEFKNPTKVYNASQSQIIDVSLWRYLRPIKVLRKVSKIVSTENKQKMRSLLGGHKIKSNFELSDFQKNYVLNELNDDLKKLSNKYGVDLSTWNIEIKN
jgi:hypothetical protein